MYDQHCRPSSPSSSSSSSSSPTDGDDEGEYHQPFNQQKLLQVLSLGRLRSLQELSLKIDADTFFMVWTKSINTNKWKDSADLLHKIRDSHPNIKKLGLELTTYECEDQRERRGCIGTHDRRKDKIAQLAEELIQFEEVDLSSCRFGSSKLGAMVGPWDSTAVFLMALLTASATLNSKLKILTIPDHVEHRTRFQHLEDSCFEALREARERLTVNIVDTGYQSRYDNFVDTFVPLSPLV